MRTSTQQSVAPEYRIAQFLPQRSDWARIFIYALFLVIGIWVLYPLFWLLINSFKTDHDLYSDAWSLPHKLEWVNYERAWKNGISRFLLNSIVVTCGTVAVVSSVSMMAAYALARFEFRGKIVVTGLILGGLMLAPEVALIPLFQILQWMGIFDTYLALILPTAAFGLSFTTLLLFAYIKNLPEELEEAARIDGAGPFRVFWYVIVPLSRPMLASASLLQAMRTWNEFVFALTFVQGDETRTLPAGLLQFTGEFRDEWTVIMAGLVISAVPMIVLFFVTQRHFVRGLSSGGIKG